MKLSVILIFILLVFHDAASDEIVCTINTKRAIHRVSDKFLSISIDPAVLLTGLNLSEKSLLLARHLSPAYIRVAGPSTQFVKYALNDDKFRKHSSEGAANVEVTPSMWFGINQWLALANLTPVFGINDAATTNGVWNPKPTLPMMELSDKLNVTCLWQLGFDCSNKTELQYKGDLMLLRHILDAIPSKKDSWKAVASDISRCIPTDNIDALRGTLDDLSGIAGAVMWEPVESNEYTFPSIDAMSKLLMFPNRSPVPVWTTAPRPSRSVSFATAILWMKQLSDAATMGYDVIFRQPRLHEMFSESPAYWSSLLYKNLMGRNVLDVKTTGLASEVYVYAHCTNNQDDFPRRGALTILVINNSTDEQMVQVRLGSTYMKSIEVQSYILTTPYEASPQVFLNDAKLTTSVFQGNQTVFTPKLRRAKVSKYLTLSVPSKSISFFVLPGVRIPVCVNDENGISQLLEEIEHDQTLPLFEEHSIEIEPRITSTQPTLREMQRAIERELASDERHYHEHNVRQIYNKYQENRERVTKKPLPDKKHNEIKTYYSDTPRDRTIIDKRAEKQKVIDLELTSAEVRKILADRARARAAAKNIMFTDEELEELMKKASEKFLDKTNYNDKFRRKFKRQIDQMHHLPPTTTNKPNERGHRLSSLLHRDEKTPKASSRIETLRNHLKSNRLNSKSTTPRQPRISTRTKSEDEPRDTLIKRLEARNEERLQARTVARGRGTSKASEPSTKGTPIIRPRTSGKHNGKKNVVAKSPSTSTQVYDTAHESHMSLQARSHEGIRGQHQNDLGFGHLIPQSQPPEIGHKPTSFQQKNENKHGHLLHSRVNDGNHYPVHPHHSNDQHQINSQMKHNQLPEHSQHTNIHSQQIDGHLSNQLHHHGLSQQLTHKSNDHLSTHLSHHEPPITPLYQMSHHEPFHESKHASQNEHETRNNYLPLSDMIHGNTYKTQHRATRNSDKGLNTQTQTSTPTPPGQIPVFIQHEPSPQRHKRAINMKLLALETAQQPNRQFKSRFQDKEMKEATMRKPDETSEELLRSLEETLEEMSHRRLPQGNVFAGLATSDQLESLENEPSDIGQNTNPVLIKHKPLLSNLFTMNTKPIIQPSEYKTAAPFDWKFSQRHGEIKLLPKFQETVSKPKERIKAAELPEPLKFVTGNEGFDSIEEYEDWDYFPAIHEYMNQKSSHHKSIVPRIGDVNNFHKPPGKPFREMKSRTLSHQEKDDFDYSKMLRDEDYGEIDSDEKPLRFKRSINNVEKEVAKIGKKSLKDLKLRNLVTRKERKGEHNIGLHLHSRNKQTVIKPSISSIQTSDIDDDDDPFGKQSFHFVIGDPERAMKTKINDRQKEKQFAYLKSRLAHKKKMEQKKKPDFKKNEDINVQATTKSVNTANNDVPTTTRNSGDIGDDDVHKHEVVKRSSEIDNEIFKWYEPVINKKRSWKPSDITSLKGKGMYLTNAIRREPIDDADIFKSYLKNSRKFKRNIDRDADVSENSLDSIIPDAIKGGNIPHVFKVSESYEPNMESGHMENVETLEENTNQKNDTGINDMNEINNESDQRLTADEENKTSDNGNITLSRNLDISPESETRSSISEEDVTRDSKSVEDSKSGQVAQTSHFNLIKPVNDNQKVSNSNEDEDGFFNKVWNGAKGFFVKIYENMKNMFGLASSS